MSATAVVEILRGISRTPRALFERDEIGAAQRRGPVLQRFVRGIRTVLVQDLVPPDRDFEIRGVQARIDGNDDGVTASVAPTEV